MSCTRPGWRSGSLQSHCASPGTCGETALHMSSPTSRPDGPRQHPATSFSLVYLYIPTQWNFLILYLFMRSYLVVQVLLHSFSMLVKNFYRPTTKKTSILLLFLNKRNLLFNIWSSTIQGLNRLNATSILFKTRECFSPLPNFVLVKICLNK